MCVCICLCGILVGVSTWNVTTEGHENALDFVGVYLTRKQIPIPNETSAKSMHTTSINRTHLYFYDSVCVLK